MVLPIVIFILFHIGLDAITAYIVEIVGIILITCNALVIIHKQIPEFNIRLLIRVILNCLGLVAIASATVFPIYSNMPSNFFRLLFVSLTYAVALSTASYFLLLTKDNRAFVKSKLLLFKQKLL